MLFSTKRIIWSAIVASLFAGCLVIIYQQGWCSQLYNKFDDSVTYFRPTPTPVILVLAGVLLVIVRHMIGAILCDYKQELLYLMDYTSPIFLVRKYAKGPREAKERLHSLLEDLYMLQGRVELINKRKEGWEAYKALATIREAVMRRRIGWWVSNHEWELLSLCSCHYYKKEIELAKTYSEAHKLYLQFYQDFRKASYRIRYHAPNPNAGNKVIAAMRVQLRALREGKISQDREEKFRLCLEDDNKIMERKPFDFLVGSNQKNWKKKVRQLVRATATDLRCQGFTHLPISLEYMYENCILGASFKHAEPAIRSINSLVLEANKELSFKKPI